MSVNSIRSNVAILLTLGVIAPKFIWLSSISHHLFLGIPVNLKFVGTLGISNSELSVDDEEKLSSSLSTVKEYQSKWSSLYSGDARTSPVLSSELNFTLKPYSKCRGSHADVSVDSISLMRFEGISKNGEDPFHHSRRLLKAFT